MKLFFILILTSLFTSCNSEKKVVNKNPQEEAFVKFFKIQTFCSCYKHSFKENDVIKIMSEEDLLGTYDGLADPVFLKKIDSLGKEISETIKPSEYLDFEGKKRITATCLDFYTSSKLDSIARAEYKKFNR